jgi:hypothetical protein
MKLRVKNREIFYSDRLKTKISKFNPQILMEESRYSGVFCFVVVMVLWFELRVLHLQRRRSTRYLSYTKNAGTLALQNSARPSRMRRELWHLGIRCYIILLG